MKIKCISCRFAKIDEPASDSKWTAYMCSNPKSEYHKALLNVTLDGKQLTRISWPGCKHGEKKVKPNAQKTKETLRAPRLPRANRQKILPSSPKGVQQK